MEIIFRKPAKSDREDIMNFFVRYNKNFFPPYSENMIKTKVNNIYSCKEKCIMALTNKGDIIALVTWRQYDKDKEYGYLSYLQVRPDYRRKYIGKTIREMAMIEIKNMGFRGVYSTTWKENQAMIKMNKNLGAKIVKTYPDEENCPGRVTILFRKDFV